jgi:hypothetical protein
MVRPIEIIKNHQPFKYNIRLKPFLKASINNIMANILIKHGLDNIIRINTDGFSTKKKWIFKFKIYCLTINIMEKLIILMLLIVKIYKAFF